MADSERREGPSLIQRLQIRAMPWFTPLHVRIYRASKGRIANRTPAGGPVMLLTTTGRRSGKPRTVALGCLDDGDALYVAASNGGLAQEPGWIHNLRDDAAVQVRYGDRDFTATAEVLSGEEREEHWARYTAAYPDYADAQRWAGRTIPLVRIPLP